MGSITTLGPGRWMAVARSEFAVERDPILPFLATGTDDIAVRGECRNVGHHFKQPLAIRMIGMCLQFRANPTECYIFERRFGIVSIN
jgi:hypothetical protein